MTNSLLPKIAAVTGSEGSVLPEVLVDSAGIVLIVIVEAHAALVEQAVYLTRGGTQSFVLNTYAAILFFLVYRKTVI